VIVNQFPMLSSYAAILARLSALADAADAAIEPAPTGIEVVDDESRLAFEGLTLRAPYDGRPLVRELSIDLEAGSRLLVRGSRDATAALLRVVAGVWSTGEGRVVRPAGDGLLVLTDRPHLFVGTLRELLAANDDADGRVRAAIRAVGLDDVVERAGGLDVELKSDFLSPEERQLVELCRLLLAAPRFAVLTHLEAGVGAARAADVLVALAASGAGYVVLGDEALGPEHFDAVVEIAPDGTWTHTVTRKGAA
jgi:vitamin B12/bleomycin/antimicrobial peptide transport system ATP-binding/permease protein